MKKNFHIDTKWFKILVRAAALWMESQRGEGELGIKSHGRFWISNLSFSQETGAIGQQIPRIGVKRPKAYRESSAGCTTSLTLSPPFFSFGQSGPKIFSQPFCCNVFLLLQKNGYFFFNKFF